MPETIRTSSVQHTDHIAAILAGATATVMGPKEIVAHFWEVRKELLARRQVADT